MKLNYNSGKNIVSYQQAVPINGDNIPPLESLPPHLELSNKDFYFAVLCYTEVGILQVYLATRGPKMRLGTRKCIGVKRLTP